MNNKMFFYAGIMLFGVFISSVSQVILKKATTEKHESFIKEYLNTKVIGAYILFFAATLLAVQGYKVVPLSLGNILDTTGYVYITIFGITIFKEKISGMKILALVLIICGIVVYSACG